MLPQQVVAREVPVGVVHALEVVDVEHDERQARVVALGPIELALQRLVEVPAVEDLREAVHRHQPVDLLVVVDLDVLAGHELQDRSADAHLVAVLQPLLAHRARR